MKGETANASAGAAFQRIGTLVSKPFDHLQNFAMPDNLNQLFWSILHQIVRRY